MAKGRSLLVAIPDCNVMRAICGNFWWDKEFRHGSQICFLPLLCLFVFYVIPELLSLFLVCSARRGQHEWGPCFDS